MDWILSFVKGTEAMTKAYFAIHSDLKWKLAHIYKFTLHNFGCYIRSSVNCSLSSAEPPEAYILNLQEVCCLICESAVKDGKIVPSSLALLSNSELHVSICGGES